ncbi:hypothetical protein BC2230_60050 [Burkholderia cepacia]
MSCLRVSDVKTSTANYPFGRPPNVHYTWCQLSGSALDIVCVAGETRAAPAGGQRRRTGFSGRRVRPGGPGVAISAANFDGAGDT